jgi:hypothetical protein
MTEVREAHVTGGQWAHGARMGIDPTTIVVRTAEAAIRDYGSWGRRDGFMKSPMATNSYSVCQRDGCGTWYNPWSQGWERGGSWFCSVECARIGSPRNRRDR